MAEIENCPICNTLYHKTSFMDCCKTCYDIERKQLQTVQHYVGKRENRTATMTEVEDATGVPKETIVKFIKKGRLRAASLPNIGYKCEKCENLIHEGLLCAKCKKGFTEQVNLFEKEEARKNEIKNRSAIYKNNVRT